MSAPARRFCWKAEKEKYRNLRICISFADFNGNSGGYLPESTYGEYRYLAYAVEQFFANGGSRCYVMRTAAADAAIAAVSAGGITIKAKNPGKWGNEIKVTAVAATKGKTAVLEATGEDPAAKVYTVANGSIFAEGDTVVIRNNGKAVGYNKIAMVQGNTITLALPVKEDLVDKSPVPRKVLSTCEMNMEVSYRDQVEIYEGVSLNADAASFISKVLSKSDLVDVSAEEIKEAINPCLYLAQQQMLTKQSVFLAGGSDGGKKAITDDVFLGVDGGPGKRTVLQPSKSLIM